MAREPDGRVYLHVIRPGQRSAALNRALGLAATGTRAELVDAVAPVAGKISLQGRSLLAAMVVLAYGVEVPPADVARVAPLLDAHDRVLDARAALGTAMRIDTGDTAPADAAVAVRARERWYSIADTDLDSKNTLALLRMLLFLKSAEQLAPAPVVTIPSR